MFKVIEKKTGKVTEVYDACNMPEYGNAFLVYHNEEWLYRCADLYRPITEEDRKKEFLEKLKNMPTVLQPAPPPVQVICPDPELGKALRKAAEEGQDERLEGLCTFGPLKRMDDEEGRK